VFYIIFYRVYQAGRVFGDWWLVISG